MVGGDWGSNGWYHHQSARSPVGPGHGGTSGGDVVGGRASELGLSCWPSLSTTDRRSAGPVMVMTAAMMQPMVIRTEQHQVVQLGRPAVLPVPDVMSVQTTGGPAAGHRAGPVAVLEGTAQPPTDRRVVRPAPMS